MQIASTLTSALCDTTIRNPWTNVYGLARSLLAIGTLSTLVFHDPDVLFRPQGVHAHDLGGFGLAARYSLFVVLDGGALEQARWLATGILLASAAGWRPRLLALPHWWVSFSLASSAVIVEGGDQVTAILTLLLLPVALTDRRAWHWGAPPSISSAWQKVLALTAASAIIIVRVQVAIVYLVAAVAKLSVTEWVNGTALYYWFHHPLFGAPGWLMPALSSIMRSGMGITIMTWGVIIIELTLFSGLFMRDRYRSSLLSAGIIFHILIAMIHGLVAFSIAMVAALILYLRPVDKEFHLAFATGKKLKREQRYARHGCPRDNVIGRQYYSALDNRLIR